MCYCLPFTCITPDHKSSHMAEITKTKILMLCISMIIKKTKKAGNVHHINVRSVYDQQLRQYCYFQQDWQGVHNNTSNYH